MEIYRRSRVPRGHRRHGSHSLDEPPVLNPWGRGKYGQSFALWELVGRFDEEVPETSGTLVSATRRLIPTLLVAIYFSETLPVDGTRSLGRV